jgi:phosphoenolpyruvate carboxykinase (ATP)
MPGFNLAVPKACHDVDTNILMPINTWKDKAAFNEQAKKLAHQFHHNFEKYMDGTPIEVVQKGGPSEGF